jgi:hypothetical protein
MLALAQKQGHHLSGRGSSSPENNNNNDNNNNGLMQLVIALVAAMTVPEVLLEETGASAEGEVVELIGQKKYGLKSGLWGIIPEFLFRCTANNSLHRGL